MQSQATIGQFSGLQKEDLARVGTWFPGALNKEGKAHYWDMEVLRSILSWDDPVVMLGQLVASNPEWWTALGDAETEPSSPAQEKAVRRAFGYLWQSGPTVPDDPVILVDRKRFLENWAKRLK
jgi:hypothetical protein